jgi:hypothetical protein
LLSEANIISNQPPKDAEGDTLRFSIANKPGWLSFSSSTGALSGTPTNSSLGVFPSIKIWVTDGRASRFSPWLCNHGDQVDNLDEQ